jgi:hypothetical protein
MEMGRGWQELGVVDTIYKEEDDDECFDSPTMLSFATTSRSSSPLSPGRGGGSLPCKPGKSRSSVIGVRLCNWGLVKFNIDVVEIID